MSFVRTETLFRLLKLMVFRPESFMADLNYTLPAFPLVVSISVQCIIVSLPAIMNRLSFSWVLVIGVPLLVITMMLTKYTVAAVFLYLIFRILSLQNTSISFRRCFMHSLFLQMVLLFGKVCAAVVGLSLMIINGDSAFEIISFINAGSLIRTISSVRFEILFHFDIFSLVYVYTYAATLQGIIFEKVWVLMAISSTSWAILYMVQRNIMSLITLNM